MKSFTSGATRVDRRGRCAPAAQSSGGEQQRLCSGRARARAHDPMSLRCECSDISMPKPASNVTMDVPP